MDATVVSKDKLRKVFIPPPFLLSRQSSQHLVHGSIEPFTLAIALRVIGRGAALPYSVDLAKLFYHVSLKAAPLV